VSKYRVLDLFSGIGGFTLGLDAAGLVTVAFCEVSTICRHLLAHHWPEVKQYDDVTTLTAERLASDGLAVDVICGGFPCQDLSYAGAGAGLGGARSGLFWEIVRLVRELIAAGRRPKYLILENVAALLGRGLGEVLGALAALGYDLWWDCIPAFAVGAPHRRDRVWIVAYPRGEQHQGFGDAFRRAVAEELSRAAVANTDSGRGATGQPTAEVARQGCSASSDGGALPDAAGDGRDQGLANARGCGPGSGAQQRPRLGGRGWWLAEPDVGRVAHGVPARVDRLHGLGNAVVPQVPEILGRAIIAAEEQCARLAA